VRGLLARPALRQPARHVPVRHAARRPHPRQHGALRARRDAAPQGPELNSGSGSQLLAALGLAASCALAQDYPSRPVHIIVPSTPGGGYDVMGRLVGERLSRLLGQPFVVENRAGGGTLVGTQAVATAAPDGYTLLIGGLANMAFNPGLHKDLRYDPGRDFAPVAIVGAFTYALIGRKDLAAASLEEL